MPETEYIVPSAGKDSLPSASEGPRSDLDQTYVIYNPYNGRHKHLINRLFVHYNFMLQWHEPHLRTPLSGACPTSRRAHSFLQGRKCQVQCLIHSWRALRWHRSFVGLSTLLPMMVTLRRSVWDGNLSMGEMPMNSDPFLQGHMSRHLPTVSVWLSTSCWRIHGKGYGNCIFYVSYNYQYKVPLLHQLSQCGRQLWNSMLHQLITGVEITSGLERWIWPLQRTSPLRSQPNTACWSEVGGLSHEIRECQQGWHQGRSQAIPVFIAKFSENIVCQRPCSLRRLAQVDHGLWLKEPSLKHFWL